MERDGHAVVLARAVFRNYFEVPATLGTPCQMVFQRDGKAQRLQIIARGYMTAPLLSGWRYPGC